MQPLAHCARSLVFVSIALSALSACKSRRDQSVLRDAQGSGTENGTIEEFRFYKGEAGAICKRKCDFATSSPSAACPRDAATPDVGTSEVRVIKALSQMAGSRFQLPSARSQRFLALSENVTLNGLIEHLERWVADKAEENLEADLTNARAMRDEVLGKILAPEFNYMRVPNAFNSILQAFPGDGPRFIGTIQFKPKFSELWTNGAFTLSGCKLNDVRAVIGKTVNVKDITQELYQAIFFVVDGQTDKIYWFNQEQCPDIPDASNWVSKFNASFGEYAVAMGPSGVDSASCNAP